MSKPKTSNVFLAGGTITEQDMLAYLRNELSQEQRQQFDKLLADDPFAQDALEGLQTAESVNAASRIAGIRQQVREKTGTKETRLVQMPWINYAYAAVVFGVLVGVGFLIIYFAGNNKNELALNKPGEAATEQTLFEEKADSVAMATNTVSEVLSDTTVISVADNKMEDAGGASMQLEKTQSTQTVAPAVPAKTVTTSAKISADMNSTVVATSNADMAVSGAAKASMERGAIKTEESKNLKETKSIEVTARTEAIAVQKKADSEKSKSAPVSLDDAMKSFNAASYQKAAEQFDDVLKRDPNNTEALYFGGISDYLNGKSAKSEKSFDKLVKTNRYTEGSKWYKANILLKKGKKEEATKILNELSGSSGMYKERAVKKLEELK